MGNMEFKSRIIPETIDRMRTSFRKDSSKASDEEGKPQNDTGLLQQLRSNAVCVEEDIGGEEEDKTSSTVAMATECVDKAPPSHDPHPVTIASNKTYSVNSMETGGHGGGHSGGHGGGHIAPLQNNDVSQLSSSSLDRTETKTPVSPGLNSSGPNHASGTAFVTAHDKVKQLKRKNTPASLPTVNKLNARDKMKGCDLLSEEMMEEEEDEEAVE